MDQLIFLECCHTKNDFIVLSKNKENIQIDIEQNEISTCVVLNKEQSLQLAEVIINLYKHTIE